MRRNTIRSTTIPELGRGLKAIRFTPAPPRGLTFDTATGILSWDPPTDTFGITHYRIYAPTEDTLVREIPSGQTRLQDNLTSDRVFVSCYSAPYQRESAKIGLVTSIAPVAGGGVIMSPLITLAANTAISINVTNDALMHVLIRQPSAGTGPFTITFDAAKFRINTPPNTIIGLGADEYTSFLFASRSGKWWLVGDPIIYL